MTNNFLQDSQGNKSSKRLWGSILLFIGIVFSMILFGFSLVTGAKDASTALGIINIFLIAGGSMLGIGVFEKAIKK
jgi:multidrug transporter EmrE-like cation transporter